MDDVAFGIMRKAKEDTHPDAVSLSAGTYGDGKGKP